MSAAAAEGSAGAGGTVTVPAQYGAFEIFPRDEAEEADERMPRTVGHAYLVLVQTGETESAERCRNCMDRYLQVLAAGPSGNLSVNVGQACICWGCGYVGIPANTDDLDAQSEDPIKRRMPPFAVCKQCKSGEKTNYVIGKAEGDSPLPFIEAAMQGPA